MTSWSGLHWQLEFSGLVTLVLAFVLALSAAPSLQARDPAAPPPARPTDIEALKAYDVLERHCARCHQSGMLQKRAKPAAELGNILRLDEVARDAHLVRPGNPDASRLYTLMVGRRMPYDVYHEGASQEAPSADEIDVMRAWIAGLKPATARSSGTCMGRTIISNDALQIAIAQDVERLPTEQAGRVRYVTLTALWSACANEAYLSAARKAASVLVSSLSRGSKPIQLVPVNSAKSILRVDLADMQWTAQEWDRLAGLSPYVQPSAFATTARGPSVSSAVLAAAQPVRLDWLAFVLSEDTRKRASQAPGLTPNVRSILHGLLPGPSGLSKQRMADPADFQAALVQVGIDPAPAFDQIDMLDLLVRAYARDISPEHVTAEIGTDAATLASRLDGGPKEIANLMLRLAQGAVSRVSLEPVFAAISAHVLGQEPPQTRDSFGLSSLGRPPARGAQPFVIEMIAEKPSYQRNEAASLIVRSETDCHLTLVSVAPSGRAVVLLPNDWDRSTFLPAGKEQRFPRDDSPFRLRLDAPGWETIVAGCNPSAPLFDGILHDFNLEKFTSLGDYRNFLMRMSEGIPMMTPPTPDGERKAAPKRLDGRLEKRQSRAAKAETEAGKPDPTARTAIRFEVRSP
jgi:mono/diheme cytochrome c family protein